VGYGEVRIGPSFGAGWDSDKLLSNVTLSCMFRIDEIVSYCFRE